MKQEAHDEAKVPRAPCLGGRSCCWGAVAEPRPIRLRVPLDIPTRLVSVYIRQRENGTLVAVIELLSHESAPMRALAAQTLGRIGVTDGGVEAVLDRASRDPNVAVQTAAKFAMRQIRVRTNDGKRAAVH